MRALSGFCFGCTVFVGCGTIPDKFLRSWTAFLRRLGGSVDSESEATTTFPII